MKTKEIIILIVATLVIGGSLFYTFQLLFPKDNQGLENAESKTIEIVNTEFDEETYTEIESLSDYGEPNLENIGKTDLFSGI